MMTLRRKNVTKKPSNSCMRNSTTHHMYFYGKGKARSCRIPISAIFPHLVPCGHETCAKNIEAVLDVTPQKIARYLTLK